MLEFRIRRMEGILIGNPDLSFKHPKVAQERPPVVPTSLILSLTRWLAPPCKRCIPCSRQYQNEIRNEIRMSPALYWSLICCNLGILCRRLKQWENQSRLLLATKRCCFKAGKCRQLMVCCCKQRLCLIDRLASGLNPSQRLWVGAPFR